MYCEHADNHLQLLAVPLAWCVGASTGTEGFLKCDTKDRGSLVSVQQIDQCLEPLCVQKELQTTGGGPTRVQHAGKTREALCRSASVRKRAHCYEVRIALQLLTTRM